jgi:hypothetical protein
MKTLSKLLPLVVAISAMYACSIDRTLLPEKDDIKTKTFENSYNISLFTKQKLTPTKITIKNTNQLPITTKKGTKIWVYDYDFLTSGNKIPQYPIDLEIIELYTLKDIILYEKPTTSYDRILTTAGAIYWNVLKDGEILSKVGNSSYLSIPAQKTDAEMWLFYGNYDGREAFTWTPADTIRQANTIERPIIFANKAAYEIFPDRLGWINCDKFYEYNGEKTTIKFTSEYPNLDAIKIFIVFPNINSVIQVWDGESLQCPVGETAKIIAIAETKENEVYAFFKDITVEANHKIEIKLEKTTEQEVLSALERL